MGWRSMFYTHRVYLDGGKAKLSVLCGLATFARLTAKISDTSLSWYFKGFSVLKKASRNMSRVFLSKEPFLNSFKHQSGT